MAAKPAVEVQDKADHNGVTEPGQVLGDPQHHDGTPCPFCGIGTVCGHPVHVPPLPSWQANVWVRVTP